MKNGDRRPRQVRRPQWSPELAEVGLRLRKAHPGMGKEKLWKPMDREDVHTFIHLHSGRILKRLKVRGALIEPPRNGITRRKRRLVRLYATWKLKGYRRKPGDLVQVDTLDVRPLPSVGFKPIDPTSLLSSWLTSQFAVDQTDQAFSMQAGYLLHFVQEHTAFFL